MGKEKKEKTVPKNAIVNTITTAKLSKAVVEINLNRLKYKKPNTVQINYKIKIKYDKINAYVYYNDILYLRVVCGNNAVTLLGGSLVGGALTAATLGLTNKVTSVEIIPPEEKYHKKEFYKSIEKEILDFCSKYKDKLEKEAAKK